jgi:hypothetical protein
MLFLSRIIGTICYFVFAFYFTNGNVDAFVYETWGSRFADYFTSFDFRPIYDPSMYRGGEFFYTNFVNYPTALFLMITNGDELTVYYIYSLISFTGILYFIKALAIHEQIKVSASTLKLFIIIPAFWFWNSTIGKDAFQFLGFGIFVYGLVYRQKGFKKIFIILFGIFINYAVRPPFALLLIMCWAGSYFINFKDKGLIKFLKIGVGIAIAFVAIYFIQERLQVENLSVENLNDKAQHYQRGTDYGSGKIGGNSLTPGGIVMSYVNVLMRPFPWEFRSFSFLLAGIEIYIVLYLFLKSLKTINFRLPIVKFFIFWILILGLVLGLSENNIGTLARHRSLIIFAVIGLYHLGKINVWKEFKNKQSLVTDN